MDKTCGFCKYAATQVLEKPCSDCGFRDYPGGVIDPASLRDNFKPIEPIKPKQYKLCEKWENGFSLVDIAKENPFEILLWNLIIEQSLIEESETGLPTQMKILWNWWVQL